MDIFPSGKVWRQRRLFFIVGICLAPICVADSWIGGLTLTQVITSNDSNGQYVQLLVSQSISNPAGCGPVDSYISRTLPTSTLATVLTAYSLGKSVRIFLISSTCDSPTGRPLFTGVGIQN